MCPKNRSKVGVIGAGSFGTAIANLLSYNADVLLYGRQEDLIASINKDRYHVGLGVKMSDNILATSDLQEVAENFIRRRTVRHLKKGRVVIFGAGTGNPYFTTDSAASLRAIEINADAVLKGTRVDGIYTADPEKDPTAVKFDRLTFKEVYEKGLKIMDMTAFTLCEENHLPIIVFDMNKSGNLKRLVEGENIGTIVK